MGFRVVTLRAGLPHRTRWQRERAIADREFQEALESAQRLADRKRVPGRVELWHDGALVQAVDAVPPPRLT